MSKQILSVERLRFAYEGDDWSLRMDTLTLGAERMVCLVGPNGSGKSTLLRLLAGVETPCGGTVLLDGRPLAGMSRRQIAARIGYLPQESSPLFDYTVEDVVAMGRYVHGEGLGAMTPDDRHAIARALECVDMAALGRRRLSRLSGGERRRALIASVLAQEPDLLLLDEPTAALDIHHATAVMRLLSGLEGRQPAVVVVTHDINLAALFAERLLLLANGRLLTDGPPDAVVTAEHMTGVYGGDLLIERHPHTGGPLMIPVRDDGGKPPCAGDGRGGLQTGE